MSPQSGAMFQLFLLNQIALYPLIIGLHVFRLPGSTCTCIPSLR